MPTTAEATVGWLRMEEQPLYQLIYLMERKKDVNFHSHILASLRQMHIYCLYKVM